MNPDVHRWAERLFQLRRALRLDQQQMGDLLGVSREWVSKLENEKGEFSKAVKMTIEQHEVLHKDELGRVRPALSTKSGHEYPASSDPAPSMVEESTETAGSDFTGYLSLLRGIHEVARHLARGDPRRENEIFDRMLDIWRVTGNNRSPFVAAPNETVIAEAKKLIANFDAEQTRERGSPPGGEKAAQ